MTDQFQVRSFGNDCLGNITGYSVERYIWLPRPWSGRSDGLCLELEIGGGPFVGNIYMPGSFQKAREQAEQLCARLNAA